MYDWQCPNCGWAGQLTDEAQAAAVTEADKVQATHHIEHCPRCQWVVRIPIDLLRVVVTVPAAKKPAVKKVAPKKKIAKQPAKKVAAKKPAAKKPIAKKKPAAKKPVAKRKK
jgi:hypothetical protein